MELIIAVVSGLIAAFVLWWRSSSKGKRPPRLWGLPIVGFLPFLTSKPYIALMKLAKKHGDIFSIRLGSLDMLILNDFQSTKEAFLQDACIGRPPEIPFDLNKESVESGAFFGLAWKEQRRHCLHMLRDLGLGKTKMEELIQEEITELLEYFEKFDGKPFCLRTILAPSMSNNVSALMFGKRMKLDDPNRAKLIQVLNASSREAKQVGFLMFFPWLKNILKMLGFKPDKKLNEANDILKDFVMKQINEHEATFDPDNIRDFVDSYLLEIKKRGNDPAFTKGMLQDLSGAFFGAGSETVRSSVEWLVLLSGTYPKSQQRIYEEIKNVIGLQRPPIYEDYKNMPYTNAFIMEMLRWRTLIPINLLRYTLLDTTIKGYFIPKHTRILSNHWAIHHNPEYWGPDADEFNAERFLTADGKEKKFEHYAPFSVGKRSCPGEPLAKVEIFLYFTSIVQRFHIKMPEGKVADFEGELGIGLNPKPQDVVFIKRS